MLGRRIRTFCWTSICALAAAGAAPLAADELLIRGRVVSADGGELEEARVRLFPFADRREQMLAWLDGRAPAPIAVAEPAADGWFVIAAPAEDLWWLEASARDHLPIWTQLVTIAEDTTLPEVELRPARQVEVQVLGPDGKSVAGARVTARPASFAFWRTAPVLGGAGGGWRPAPRRAVTGEDGIAVVAGAPDEELALRASAPDRIESRKLDTRADAATLRLGAGRALTIRAVDRHGEPLAGVLVETGDGRWPALASESGLAELAVPSSSTLALRLSDPQGRWYLGTVAADRRIDNGPLELALAEPRRLAGRVLDADSRLPIAGALVIPTASEADRVRSDGRGAFALTVGRPGEVRLLAARRGYESGRLSVPEGSPHEPVLALQPAARVRGVVVDAAGRPLAGAEVTAQENLGGPRRMIFRGRAFVQARAVSGADGRFVLSGLEPRTAYVANVYLAGFAPGEAELPPLGPLAPAGEVRVVLDPGSRLVGSVVDRGGAPIAGARVVLRPGGAGGGMRMVRRMRDLGDEPREAWSGGDGRFELLHLEAGTFDLEVSAPGFAAATLPGVEIEPEAGTVEADPIVLEPGVEVAGRVVDAEGRPVEGVEVWPEEPDPMNQMRLRLDRRQHDDAVRSAADGHFALPDRRPGERIDLVARRSGYSVEILPGVEVPPVAPVEVVLREASSLSGRVVDGRGEPVDQARIQAAVEGGGAVSGGTVFMMSVAGFATSDDRGEFTLEDLEPGTVRLTVTAQGFRKTELSNVEIPAGKDVEGLEIVLLTGASVSGRVLASDGRPVVGARVYVVEGRQRFSMGGSNATSDGDGAFFLEGVEPGMRLIGARDEDHGEVKRELDVKSGDNRQDLVFEGGVEVSGRVLDEAGTPLGGATVTLGASSGWLGAGARESASADGSFTFHGVRDGTYRLSAEKAGFAQPAEAPEVEVAGAPVYGLEVRLGAGGVITGQIRGLDSERLPTLDLVASAPPGRYVAGEVRHDGTYRVPDVGPGEWRVIAYPPSGGASAEGRVRLDPGQAEALLDLEFGAGLRVTGEVRRGAEPAAGLSVRLSGLDMRSSAAAVTGRDGRFSMDGVEPGRYRLVVSDYSSGLQHTEEHEIRSDRDLLIELVVSRVSGRVVDAGDSSPLAGVVLRLEPLTETEPWARYLHRGGSTDASGSFSIHDVAAGGYTLVAEKEGYAPARRDLSVAAERDVAQVELSLESTDGLSMRVFLPSGRPASEVSVAVLDGAGGVVVAGDRAADQEGRVRLSTVPAGSWHLLVGTRDTAVARLAVVAPGSVGDVRLPPAGRLEVAIPELAEDRSLVTVEAIGADGQPAAFFGWGGHLERSRRGTYGRAVLTGLAPGTWRVRATTPDGRTWEGRATVAAGPNPRLVLE